MKQILEIQKVKNIIYGYSKAWAWLQKDPEVVSVCMGQVILDTFFVFRTSCGPDRSTARWRPVTLWGEGGAGGHGGPRGDGGPHLPPGLFSFVADVSSVELICRLGEAFDRIVDCGAVGRPGESSSSSTITP